MALYIPLANNTKNSTYTSSSSNFSHYSLIVWAQFFFFLQTKLKRKPKKLWAGDITAAGAT
jgi:hypothetical protein